MARKAAKSAKGESKKKGNCSARLEKRKAYPGVRMSGMIKLE